MPGPRDRSDAATVETYATADLPGIGGKMKVQTEDFQVEEVPVYEPSGDGEHLFLWVEKRDVSAGELVDRLARQLKVAARDIGVAGLKDRRAITRQYVSVPAAAENQLTSMRDPRIEILRVARHGHKLRTGHLRGNRFSILVRDPLPQAVSRLAPIVDRVLASGIPNYFGSQRFGREDNAKVGLELLRGERQATDFPARRRRFLLRLTLSAAQSRLFNDLCAQRVSAQSLHRVLAGDVMQIVESGGVFLAEDVEREQLRLEAGETRICGPLFGHRMYPAQGTPATREQAILQHYRLSDRDLRRYPQLTRGARRPYAIRLQDFQVQTEADGIRFRFTLPRGAYATSVLREFMKNDLSGPPPDCGQ